MSRHAVLAEQYRVTSVADALREHRADRETLLASLTEALRSDPHVRAAWLWGSFGRGDADDLSDLDLWLVVTEESVGAMGIRLRAYAQRTGSFITGGEAPQNGPPSGGFYGSLHKGRHGLLHLDCYCQPQSAAGEVPERAILFDRLREPTAAPLLPQGPDGSAGKEERLLTDGEDRISGGIGFAWLMLSVAAKTLAREPDSDMSLMMYPRSGLEDAAELLGLDVLLSPSDWSVPAGSLGKVRLLRSLAEKTARLTETANTQGLGLSPRPAVCLARYLDLVEGILS